MKIPRWGTKAAGIVVLALVFSYACGGVKPGVAMIKYQFDEMLIQNLGTMFLPSIVFASELSGKNTAKQWVLKSTMGWFPFVGYVTEQGEYKQVVEDEDTIAKILECQANDENHVDEKGNLVANETQEEEIVPAQSQPVLDLSIERLRDFDYLLSNFYIVDSSTMIGPEQLNADALLSENMKIDQNSQGPKILIFHTHSQETFADSIPGDTSTSIVGIGEYLTQLLTEKYGYQVMHVTETFDMAGGELDRSKAYDYAREWLEPVLEKHSSIQVLIDLHRDGVPEDRHLVTQINGRPTAQIMFYNGLSHTVSSGDLSYLPNPYIQDNLAFSFQLEYQAALYYPELYRGIYLAGFRYNLHLRPRALLLEAGAQTNTVQEVKNAMEPFADILDRVLQGEK